MMNQDQTADIEESDRIARFRQLSDLAGTSAPDIDQITLPPGSVAFMSGPVPVVRVVFPERAFFAFDSDVPLPASQRILDVIASNMKHDVPDAALTVLGHTDAVGTDSYNIDLSRRRAANVLLALVARGVNPAQLSEVAIGKRQPIAPNDTADGRALNRRVEFLISPAFSANLAAVQQRVVPARFFPIAAGLAPAATVYKLRPSLGEGQPNGPEAPELIPYGNVPLQPATPDSVTATPASNPPPIAPAPAEKVSPLPPAPKPNYRLLTPDPVLPQPPSDTNIPY